MLLPCQWRLCRRRAAERAVAHLFFPLPVGRLAHVQMHTLARRHIHTLLSASPELWISKSRSLICPCLVASGKARLAACNSSGNFSLARDELPEDGGLQLESKSSEGKNLRPQIGSCKDPLRSISRGLVGAGNPDSDANICGPELKAADHSFSGPFWTVQPGPRSKAGEFP